MSFAFFLNTVFESSFLGFLILGLIFLVVTVMVYFLSKSGVLAKAFEEAILREEEKAISDDESF